MTLASSGVLGKIKSSTTSSVESQFSLRMMLHGLPRRLMMARFSTMASPRSYFHNQAMLMVGPSQLSLMTRPSDS